jgi:hypothetical protein
MTPKPENPFFVLKFGKRLSTENLVIGFVPWILLTALEIEFCVLAWNGQSMAMTWYLIVGQIFLLGPVLGYFAQLQGIRCLENIFRRVSYEELMITTVNGDDFLQFSLSKVRTASRIGLGINLLAGSAPLLYSAWILGSQPTSASPPFPPLPPSINIIFCTLPIILIIILKIIFTFLFQRHALLIGMERLLNSKAYIKPRLMALGRIISELYFITAFLFPLVCLGLPSLAEVLGQSCFVLVLSLLFVYTPYLAISRTRKRHYQLAFDAIEKWRLNEEG